MEREVFAGSARWEPVVGYSRVIRVGPHVFVAGTTATDASGRLVGGDDPYLQAQQVFANIREALARAGARPEHVVRTRMFVTRIEHWEAVGRAHGEMFGAIRPVSTLVQVTGLVDPAMLVEVEADALIHDGARGAADEAPPVE